MILRQVEAIFTAFSMFPILGTNLCTLNGNHDHIVECFVIFGAVALKGESVILILRQVGAIFTSFCWIFIRKNVFKTLSRPF